MSAPNFENMTDAQLRLYAVRCVRRVQRLMRDPRSLTALDVAERYARGEATDKELLKAWVAAAEAATAAPATSAAYAAAYAAWAAAAASWDAADAATAYAAFAAAWAAADAAAEAAATWAAAAAAAAAWDAERAEQKKILDEIREVKP